MNIRKYFIITDTNVQNSNPGDHLIGKGIEYLVMEAEKRMDNFPIFNYVSIFDSNEDVWDRVYKEADYLIIAGTPQLGAGNVPERFNQTFYDKVKKAKDKGIIIANLWAGICDDRFREIDKGAEFIAKKHGDFLKKNFSLFDYITVRDLLSHKVLNNLGIENTHLLDSVFYSPKFFNVEKCNNAINVVSLKGLGNDFHENVISALHKIEKLYNRDRPLFYVAHDINDYKRFYGRFNNLICVNNPRDLLKIYSKAEEVVSFRVHGSIPSIYFGAKVQHIKIDSRSNNVEYTGLKSMMIDDFVKNPRLELQEIDIKDVFKRDKEIFLSEYYRKCQNKLGANFFSFAKRYVGEGYWNGSGDSGYSNPICKSPIQVFLAQSLSKLNFEKGLELGCAGGYFTHWVNRLGKDFYGVDLSSVAVEAGKKEFTNIKDKIQATSIHDLSMFGDNTFDLFYSQQVMEHLPTELVPDFVAEVYRVSKPGALLALFLVIGYEGQVAKADHDVDQTHWNLKTKDWWDKQFEKRGFIAQTELLVDEVDILQSPQIKNLHRLIYRKV